MHTWTCAPESLASRQGLQAQLFALSARGLKEGGCKYTFLTGLRSAERRPSGRIAGRSAGPSVWIFHRVNAGIACHLSGAF